jgi:hypothetical protein
MPQKPLASLDYLFAPASSPVFAPASSPASAPAPAAPPAQNAPAVPAQDVPASAMTPASASASVGQSSIDEAAVALGNPVLTALYRDPQGKQTAFQLIDTLDVGLRDLSPVLDILSERFRWIDIDRSDRKGNYQISLTPRGRDYIEKMGLIKAL